LAEFTAFLYNRSDAVLIALLQFGFWLLLICLTLLIFRIQLRTLLGGLSNVKFAGVSVQLKDRHDQIEAYLTLGEAFVGMLSQSGVSVDSFWNLFPATHVERLYVFALKYFKDTEKEAVNLELLRNIALLLMRHDRFEQSIEILDKLLAIYPNNLTCQHIKASTLMHTRLHKKVDAAAEMYSALCERYPDDFICQMNHVCCMSILGKHEEAMTQLAWAISYFGFDKVSAWLENPLLANTRNNARELFMKTTKKPK